MTQEAADERRAELRKMLSRSVLASTGGLALMASTAQAQSAESGVPEGFQAASDLPNVVDVRTMSDGSLQLTLSDGRVLAFEAADVVVVDGQVYLAQSAIEGADFALASAAGGGGGAGLALGVLGGGALQHRERAPEHLVAAIPVGLRASVLLLLCYFICRL